MGSTCFGREGWCIGRPPAVHSVLRHGFAASAGQGLARLGLAGGRDKIDEDSHGYFLCFSFSRALLDKVCSPPGFPAHNTFWFQLASVIVSVALYVLVYVVLVSLPSIVFYVGDMPVCREIVLMIRGRV